jgi:hypothetical protein
MVPEDFTRYLPPLAYQKLKITPPLTFRHVSARFFPLRANLDILQKLCDSYLNIVPPEAGMFRAPVPYVFLVLLDYGQMGEKEMRTGWFSQVEVYFGVPVEWYKRVDGQWVFHDWGVITPYIFVNDSVSVSAGRMVYGFPKILATVELTNSEWVKNPIAPTTLARISTKVFPKTYMGGNLQEKVFLEIDRAALTNWRLPFDPTCPNMPWMIGPNLAETLGGLGRDAFWLAQSMRICPVSPFIDPSFLSDMLSKLQPSFTPDGDGFVLNSINVKQFRREDDPSEICFRALTNGTILTNAVNGAGLLGENHIFLGDLTGAHSIRLFEQSTLPIAQTLGLEVYKSWSDQGISVCEFKPVLPFWIDVNLTYNAGENIAWQNQDGIWKDGSGKPFPIETPPDPEFNNAVSTSLEAVAGPFQFPGTTIRVIPLLADKVRQQQFLNKYLNEAMRGPILREDGGLEPHEFRFKLWARGPEPVDKDDVIKDSFAPVFLTVSSYKSVISSTNNVGDWAKFELSFMIPVKWQRRSIKEGATVHERGEWETIGVGLVPAFSMADNCVTSFSRLEIQGIPSLTAEFVRPESVWLSDSPKTQPKQMLLRVNAELLAALGAGQTAKFEPVIEISDDDPQYGYGSAPEAEWRWAQILRKEQYAKKNAELQHGDDLKIARALSLELLGNRAPFCLYTLKQFPDVSDPNKACYQALVRVPRKVTDLSNLLEIEETISVRIFGYPDFDIVEELGLQALRLEERTTGIVYCTQGLRPFYIRGTIDEALGECLLRRSGISPWTIRPGALNTLLHPEQDALKDAPQIEVDKDADTRQDRRDPSRTAETMLECLQRKEFKKDFEWVPISVREARQAVDRMDPHMVIESILSREWSNFDSEARWRRGKLKLVKELGLLSQDGVIKPFAESELYRKINNDLAKQPGAVAHRISLEYLESGDTSKLLDQEMFRKIRAAVIEGPSQLEAFLEGIRNDKTWPWVWDWLSALKKLKPEDLLTQVSMMADSWRVDVTKMIRRQRCFTKCREKMEESIDALSPVVVLGLEGVRAAYAKMNKEKTPFPGAAYFVEMGKQMFDAMRCIQKLLIEGEPSRDHNLDPVALAGEQRLKEMLDALDAEFKEEVKDGAPPAIWLEKAVLHASEVSEIVNLARAKSEAQHEALLFKLSRAYQKPDFCIRRDAFSTTNRDRFLPLALSWDEDWYYGEDIDVNTDIATAILISLAKSTARGKGTSAHRNSRHPLVSTGDEHGERGASDPHCEHFTSAAESDETQPSLAEYPPAGESQPPAQSVPESAPSDVSPRSME